MRYTINAKPVNLFDPETGEIIKFDGRKDAAEFLGETLPHVSRAINKAWTLGGYYLYDPEIGFTAGIFGDDGSWFKTSTELADHLCVSRRVVDYAIKLGQPLFGTVFSRKK